MRAALRALLLLLTSVVIISLIAMPRFRTAQNESLCTDGRLGDEKSFLPFIIPSGSSCLIELTPQLVHQLRLKKSPALMAIADESSPANGLKLNALKASHAITTREKFQLTVSKRQLHGQAKLAFDGTFNGYPARFVLNERGLLTRQQPDNREPVVVGTFGPSEVDYLTGKRTLPFLITLLKGGATLSVSGSPGNESKLNVPAAQIIFRSDKGNVVLAFSSPQRLTISEHRGLKVD